MKIENGKNNAAAESAQDGFYFGRYDLELSDAGGFILPKEWNDLVGDSRKVWCVPDFGEPCLDLVPFVALEKELEALRKTAMTDQEDGNTVTRISELGRELAVEASGRIVIPESLRQAVGLESEISLVGACKMIKIWPRSALAPVEKISEADISEEIENACIIE